MSTPMKPLVQHAYTFPPFPQAPEGVTITPFSEFKEYGIQAYASSDGREVDGLGIPTIELSKKHDTDDGKTEARPRKSRDAIQPSVVVNADGSKSKKYPEWYKAWEETEDSRRMNYNDMESRTDRIHSATRDFHKLRPWPPISTGVRAQFDQIQLFIGTIATTPIWHKVTKSSTKADDDDDDDDDDDIDDDDDLPTTTTVRVENQEEELSRPRNSYKRPRPRPPYATYGKKPVQVETDEEIQELLMEAKNEKEDKLIEFLNDPARGAQIYLSSYMKKQGLHFSQSNLIIIPKLWRFYINYLLRNRVLPEPEHEMGLRRALEYVELAAEELPRTMEIAKTLPDGLCNAFQECFAIKSQEHRLLTEEIDKDLGNDEPKQFDLDVKDGEVETLDSLEAAFNESLEAGNIQIVSSDVGLGSGSVASFSNGVTATEVIDEDPDSVKDTMFATSAEPPTQTETQAGGNTEIEDANRGGWGSAQDNSWENGWETSGNTEGNAQDNPWLNWSMPEPDTLMKYLGPTLFPLTHTSGVLEWSVRRIKSVTPPPPSSQLRKSPVLTEDEEPNGEAVEVELERRFTKVVLSPWLDWDKPDEGEPDHHLPCIHKFSRGKVVMTEGAVVFEGMNPEDVVGVEDLEKVEAEQSEGGGLKVHNPLKNDITILLERESAEKLKVGMGIGGLWVQIARKADLEPQSTARKKEASQERYWFLERTHSTLTSYHIV